MWLEKNDTVFVSMPGVPFEMKGIIKNGVLPRILEKGHLPFIHHRTILTAGTGESTLATRIAKLEDELPIAIKLAYLPSLGMVRLRSSSTGLDRILVQNAVDEQVVKLYE